MPSIESSTAVVVDPATLELATTMDIWSFIGNNTQTFEKSTET